MADGRPLATTSPKGSPLFVVTVSAASEPITDCWSLIVRYGSVCSTHTDIGGVGPPVLQCHGQLDGFSGIRVAVMVAGAVIDSRLAVDDAGLGGGG